MANRKSTAKKWTLIAIILFALIVIIAGTYARYITVGNATGSIDVAKWAVVMTADDGTELTSTTQDITFTVVDNDYVVEGKIAPDVTAEAEIELDLTGTEVAVDFDAVIDDEDLEEFFGASADDVELEVEVDGTAYTSGTPQTINLPNGEAFTEQNGTKTVTLRLIWTNNDLHNESDTELGEAADTLEIPVTLTAQQHVLSDDPAPTPGG